MNDYKEKLTDDSRRFFADFIGWTLNEKQVQSLYDKNFLVNDENFNVYKVINILEKYSAATFQNLAPIIKKLLILLLKNIDSIVLEGDVVCTNLVIKLCMSGADYLLNLIFTLKNILKCSNANNVIARIFIGFEYPVSARGRIIGNYCLSPLVSDKIDYLYNQLCEYYKDKIDHNVVLNLMFEHETTNGIFNFLRHVDILQCDKILQDILTKNSIYQRPKFVIPKFKTITESKWNPSRVDRNIYIYNFLLMFEIIKDIHADLYFIIKLKYFNLISEAHYQFIQKLKENVDCVEKQCNLPWNKRNEEYPLLF